MVLGVVVVSTIHIVGPRGHASNAVYVSGRPEGDRRGKAAREAGHATVASRGPATATTTGDGSTTSTTSAPITTTTTDPDGATGVLSSAAVRDYLAERAGDVTAAVYDVADGRTSLWRPGVAEDTASIVKVDILATLLHEDQEQGSSLEEEDQEEATAMIEQSDNDAASDLWDDVGQQTAIGAFDGLVGMRGTTPGTDGYWGLTTTTAADQVRLVRTVALHGPVLTDASRAYELSLMEDVEPSERWGVDGGVPAGVTVALKNGWLPLSDDDWQINSIGWVHGEGRDYVIAVLSDGNPTEGYGIQTIQGLSSLVWTSLAPAAG
jgi:beta-lactamase class A